MINQKSIDLNRQFKLTTQRLAERQAYTQKSKRGKGKKQSSQTIPKGTKKYKK